MHDNVHGEFVNNEAKLDELVDIFYRMLDKWYMCELYKSEINSQERLFEILKDPEIRLDYLVQKMTKVYEVTECI